MTCLFSSLLYIKWLLWFEELSSWIYKPAVLPNINSHSTGWKKSFHLLFNLHVSFSAPFHLQHRMDSELSSLGPSITQYFFQGNSVHFKQRGNEKAYHHQLINCLSVYLDQLNFFPQNSEILKMPSGDAHNQNTLREAAETLCNQFSQIPKEKPPLIQANNMWEARRLGKLRLASLVFESCRDSKELSGLIKYLPSGMMGLCPWKCILWWHR